MKILASLTLGLVVGFLLELIYKSSTHKQLVWPKFWNIQIYGLTAVFMYAVNLFSLPLIIEIILISVFPTLLELVTGWAYIKFTNKRLWDYTGEPINYKGLIRLRFSIYWALISLIYYYLVQPSMFGV